MKATTTKVTVLGSESAGACDALRSPLAEAARELFSGLDPSGLYTLTAAMSDTARSVSVNRVAATPDVPAPDPAPPATKRELQHAGVR